MTDRDREAERLRMQQEDARRRADELRRLADRNERRSRDIEADARRRLDETRREAERQELERQRREERQKEKRRRDIYPDFHAHIYGNRDPELHSGRDPESERRREADLAEERAQKRQFEYDREKSYQTELQRAQAELERLERIRRSQEDNNRRWLEEQAHQKRIDGERKELEAERELLTKNQQQQEDVAKSLNEMRRREKENRKKLLQSEWAQLASNQREQKAALDQKLNRIQHDVQDEKRKQLAEELWGAKEDRARLKKEQQRDEAETKWLDEQRRDVEAERARIEDQRRRREAVATQFNEERRRANEEFSKLEKELLAREEERARLEAARLRAEEELKRLNEEKRSREEQQKHLLAEQERLRADSEDRKNKEGYKARTEAQRQRADAELKRLNDELLEREQDIKRAEAVRLRTEADRKNAESIERALQESLNRIEATGARYSDLARQLDEQRRHVERQSADLVREQEWLDTVSQYLNWLWRRQTLPSKTPRSQQPGTGGPPVNWSAADDDRLKGLLIPAIMQPAQIAEARRLIDRHPNPGTRATLYRQIQYATPYISQRDNKSHSKIPGRGARETPASIRNMCNETCLAMLLESQGVVNPEDLGGEPFPQFEDYLEALRIETQLGPRTEVKTLIELGEHFGLSMKQVYFGLRDRNWTKDDWLEFRRNYLDQGYSAILSVGGHVVKIKDVVLDGERPGVPGGVLVDDPYGRLVLKPSKIRTGKDGKKTVPKAHLHVQINIPGRPDNKGRGILLPFSGEGSVLMHHNKWILVGRVPLQHQ